MSNLDQTPTGSFAETSASYLGQEFTAGGSFLLQSILVSLGNLDIGTDNFDVVAALYSTTEATEDPFSGTMLGSFNPQGQIPTNGFASVQFDSTSVISLNASSFYWFVLMPTGYRDSVVYWQYTDTFDSTGPGSILYWYTYDLYGGIGGIGYSDPALIQVNIAPSRIPLFSCVRARRPCSFVGAAVAQALSREFGAPNVDGPG